MPSYDATRADLSRGPGFILPELPGFIHQGTTLTIRGAIPVSPFYPSAFLIADSTCLYISARSQGSIHFQSHALNNSFNASNSSGAAAIIRWSFGVMVASLLIGSLMPIAGRVFDSKPGLGGEQGVSLPSPLSRR